MEQRAHLAPRADNSELSARIASYELAFRMQSAVPDLPTYRRSPKRRKLYGLDDSETEPLEKTA